MPVASFKSVHARLQISRVPSPRRPRNHPPLSPPHRAVAGSGVSSINYEGVHQFDTLTYCQRRCCAKPCRHMRRKMYRVPVSECLFENERETNRFAPSHNAVSRASDWPRGLEFRSFKWIYSSCVRISVSTLHPAIRYLPDPSGQKSIFQILLKFTIFVVRHSSIWGNNELVIFLCLDQSENAELCRKLYIFRLRVLLLEFFITCWRVDRGESDENTNIDCICCVL